MLSQLDIAPTLAAFFDVALTTPARPVERILEFASSHQPSVVVLMVIDSLDYQFYTVFTDELRAIHELVERDGISFVCETVNSPTTPAIGSILTGLRPESHGIFSNEDVGKSEIKSLLEILEEGGHKTALVLETGGARPLIGKVSYVFGVDDREDIIEYDELITRHTVSVLKRDDVQLVFSHIRAIDRFAHRGWDVHAAARVTAGNMQVIAKAISARKGMLVICGDHETHFKDKRQRSLPATVPLIVCAP